MRKFIAILIFMTIFLFACSGDPIDSTDTVTTADIETTTTAEVEVSRLDELGANDFGEREFRILDANDHPAMHINMPGDEQTGDIINDALYIRDSLINEKYNVTIKYTQISLAAEGCRVLQNAVQAGDDAYEMVIGPLPGGALGTSATSGVLTNLLDVPYISLTENWWSQLIYDSLKLNNKLFYTSSDLSPTIYQSPATLYLNKRLAADYNITTDYYGLVYDGKWTLDVLEEMTKDMRIDLDNDGQFKQSTDFFGMVYSLGLTTTNSMVNGSGIDVIPVNADGNIEMDLTNEKVLNVIDKLSGIFEPFVDDGDLHGYINGTFKTGRSLFLLHWTESALNMLRDMEDDYAILPVPKYDESQETYRSMMNSWSDAYIAVPLTADLQFSGFMMEALAYYSYINIRPQVYTITYQDKLTRDEDSANMLDIIFNTTYLEFNAIYGFGGIPTILNNAIINNAPFTSEYAAVETKVQAELAQFSENWN